MKKLNLKFRNNIKGITLIALVITIIVLLILAGVTIATLTGENGILIRAGDAKEQTEIAEEKEAIQLAYTGVIAENKGERVISSKLQEELRNNGYANATAKSNKENQILVKFEESNNWYIIDEKGIINEFEPADRTGLKIGDYVDYTFDDAEAYELLKTQTGANTQTINQIKEIKWKILNIEDDGRVDLISTDYNINDMKVGFSGALGYNNSVYLLNDICKKLYSNTNLGIEARSLNIEDIENQMNEARNKS